MLPPTHNHQLSKKTLITVVLLGCPAGIDRKYR